MQKYLVVCFIVVMHFLCAQSGSWSTPGPIPNGTGNVPEVAIGPNGVATAVWENGGQLMVSTRDSSGVWSNGQALVTVNSVNSVQIVTNNQNYTIVVWSEQENPGDLYVIRAATSTDGGQTWSSIVTLSDNTVISAVEPDVAFNDNNRAIVVWDQNATYAIANKSSDHWDTWDASTRQAVSSDPTTVNVPYVKINNNDQAVVTWLEFGSKIYASSSTDIGSSWSAPEQLSHEAPAPAEVAMYPDVALNNNGKVIVTWTKIEVPNNTIRAIFGNFDAVGVNWQAAALDVSTPTGTDYVEFPKVAITDLDRATIVWHLEGAGGSDIIQSASTIDEGAHWTYQDVSDVGSTGHNIDMELRDNSNNELLATWADLTGPNLQIQVAISYDGGVTWPNVQYISDVSRNSIYPKADVNNVGEAVVVWLDNIAGNQIYTSSRSESTDLHPAGKISSPQELLLQRDIANQVSWELLSQAAYFNVYEDKALTKRLYSGAGNHYTHHGRKKGQAYTYYITWVDSLGNESSAEAVTVR